MEPRRNTILEPGDILVPWFWSTVLCILVCTIFAALLRTIVSWLLCGSLASRPLGIGAKYRHLHAPGHTKRRGSRGRARAIFSSTLIGAWNVSMAVLGKIYLYTLPP